MDGTNWYVYCGGNPIAFVDPWGLYDVSLLEKLRDYSWAYDNRHKDYHDKANEVRDELKVNAQYLEKWDPDTELYDLIGELTSDDAYANGSSIVDIDRAITLTNEYWDDYFDRQFKEDIVETAVVAAAIALAIKASLPTPIVAEAAELEKGVPNIKYPGNDPTKSPGEGFEWRGRGTPSDGKGSWYNPRTGESLYPDLNHKPPIEPHWDYTDSANNSWRVFPDGTILPK